ncbi:outer membrane protein OmpK [Shewanella algicola]|uniref:Outer membrane protein OmpK n=1 Tax=Shewanella algicola TaxID=640633 RepID=A0A9X1Z5R5_9GAMM|nr:outer membrane protein OmpK [Shewanella algicola]MCL1104264.1 outer membrane protein OmpK [Shewanella algicola]GGP41362.1 outer membrane protein OmpK [Shewanella algicola]
MINLKTVALASTLALAGTSFTASATDFSDGDIHKNDYKWMQFNLMYAYEEVPRSPAAHTGHDYLEMEFGGRSGLWDLYGYVDVFNLTEHDASDKDGSPKMFMKFAPRLSLDALTGKDLSFGPVKELYIATLFEWGGGANNIYSADGSNGRGDGDVNNAKIGLGSDVEIPWLGKIGLNVMGYYNIEAKDWNGIHIATNWFKPFYFFENGSFLSYQGYIDWQIADDEFQGRSQAEQSIISYQGIHWHSDRFALGYGLKGYKDAYLIEDSKYFESTGFTHYFTATYKF